MATGDSSSEPQAKKAKISEEEEEDIDVDDPSSDGESGSDGGSPYNSDSDYDNPEEREQFRRYRQQVRTSEGFDVDLPDCDVLGGILPIDFDDPPNMRVMEALRACAEFAAKENQVQLVEVIKANISIVCGYMFYITLSAKSSTSPTTTDEEQPKIYQAKVWYRMEYRDMVVELFRLKKKDENPSPPDN